MSNTQKIAKIFNKDKELLNGFKILGIFPFYLKHISMPVQIKILALKDLLREIKGDSEVDVNDFYTTELMRKSMPIIFDIITTGLINGRKLGSLLYPFIRAKVKECSHEQIHGLYSKTTELSDPGFFLSYYQHMTKKDHTILKEE